jgi:hypothetical protein
VRQRLAFAALLAAAALSFVQATDIGGGGKPRPCELTPPPDMDAEAVEAPRVYDFARLTLAEAARLEGRRARYRVNLTNEKKTSGGRFVYAADAPGGEVAVFTLAAYLRDGPRTVEAELRLDYIPAKVEADGAPSPAAWVYRLEKAAVVGP